MALLKVSGARMAGLSACVPSNVHSNLEFDLLPEKDRQLLVKTTGIEERRIADADVVASDLCQAAAEKLISELGWAKDEISVLVFVSQNPDYITPATAAVLQHKMGLSKSCMAFDINLGCSGYPYGMSVVANLISGIEGGKGLLLVGDVSSQCTSPIDKSTAPIFSDAGSATAFVNDPQAGEMVFNLQTDGSGYEAIIIPEGGYRKPVSEDSLVMEEVSPGITRNKTHLIMHGIDVFNFSVKEVPPNVTALLEGLNKQVDEVDYFVFHQANKIMNESIRKKLSLTEEQVPYSLKEFGNTSSATIPVTMVSQIREQLSEGKTRLVLCGFGVGLSWGSVHFEANDLVCPPMIEL